MTKMHSPSDQETPCGEEIIGESVGGSVDVRFPTILQHDFSLVEAAVQEMVITAWLERVATEAVSSISLLAKLSATDEYSPMEKMEAGVENKRRAMALAVEALAAVLWWSLGM
jgi:hypothetical protein